MDNTALDTDQQNPEQRRWVLLLHMTRKNHGLSYTCIIAI